MSAPPACQCTLKRPENIASVICAASSALCRDCESAGPKAIR